jgi:hypothetical protein
MKLLVAILSIAIILPAILQSFESVGVVIIFHRTIINTLPFRDLAYAQNSTLNKDSTNTGTGVTTGITNVTTESELPNAASAPAPLPKTQQSQLSTIIHKKQTPLLWLASRSQSHKEGAAIALVVPVFTGAAYNDAFYVFYKHYATVRAGQNITQHLYLLSSKLTNPKSPSMPSVVASAYSMRYLAEHLKLLVPKNNVSVLTDIDVDRGSIFMDNKNRTNKYDILILGHQEYVTQREYNNLKTFVANGGTLILLDGNVFYAQVGYDSPTHTVTLIKGHGWSFNGKSAWKSIGERWKDETSQWVGSNSFCYSCIIRYANNPFNYPHREEQYITNPNDTILLNYNASFLSLNPKIVKNPTSAHAYMIAAYELNYKKGSVIGLGLYSDDIINNRTLIVFLDHLLMVRQISK